MATRAAFSASDLPVWPLIAERVALVGAYLVMTVFRCLQTGVSTV